MSEKSIRGILVFLLGFLSFTALGGGAAMILAPSGKFVDLPTSLLDRSPFPDFLIPGLILFFVLGVIPAIVVFALPRKTASPFAEKLNLYSDMHWTWAFATYIGFALIAWIQIEMAIIMGVHWLHTYFMFHGVAIVAIALLPKFRAAYRK